MYPLTTHGGIADLFSNSVKCLVALSAILLFISPAPAMDDPGFTISRMVMSKEVADKEPLYIADSFSSDDATVFCFLEAKDVEIDTSISFVWHYEGLEKARVTLPLRRGARWRTFSSKIIKNMRGSWTVELQEASGIVLNTISFQVE